MSYVISPHKTFLVEAKRLKKRYHSFRLSAAAGWDYRRESRKKSCALVMRSLF